MPTSVRRLPTMVSALACAAGLSLPTGVGLLGAEPAAGDELGKLRAALMDLQGRLEAIEQDAGHAEAGDFPRLTIRGFADVTWQASREHTPGSEAVDDNHAALGQFDLFMTSRITDNTSFLGELVVEADDTGATVVDLERAILKYAFSDQFNLQAGRFHTTLGYWNETFHHGTWLQTTIDRPRALEFEDGGGVLPAHLIGLVAKSHHLLGEALAIDGTVEAGNGRGPTSDPPQVARDANDSKAVNLALAVWPLAVPGLRLGVSAYFDHISPYDNTGAGDPNPTHGNLRERIWNGYLVYNARPWELIAEYYRIIHTPTNSGGVTATSTAYYVQLGCKLDRFTPYGRYDVLRVSDADVYFTDQGDIRTFSVGIRWDANAWVAFKLQGDHVLLHPGASAAVGDDTTINRLSAQVSCAF
jgi:hypothetical protein